MTDTVITWTAPGPGEWAVDRSHMPPGTTPIVQELMRGSMGRGMGRLFAEFGTPLETVDLRFVNGQPYTRLRPLIRPDAPSTKQPPTWLLKVAVRIHPEMRRRAKAAERTLQDEPWTAVIADWHRGGRQRLVDGNERLQAVDLAALSDDELIDQVRRLIDHLDASLEHHFWLHGFDLGPIGKYLYEARDWGVPAGRLLSLLEGASPSTSAPVRELMAIRELIDATGAIPASLDDARALSPAIDSAISGYLARRGHVLFSRYDLDGVTLGERPELVLASILNAEHHDSTAAVEARTADLRGEIPADRREQFDRLLASAREAMDLRDDNGPITAEWPLDLVRRGLHEVGQRLAARGVWERAALVFELERDEITPALFDGAPSQDELLRRADQRAMWKRAESPDTLGAPEVAPAPDVLPEAQRTMAEMVQTVMRHLGMDGDAAGSGLSGVGVGAGAVRGVARLATSAEDAFERLEPGDILVVAGTTPAYNLVLSLAGGVITAEGGPMSHAAVIARELGIPAVVGVRGALTDVPDGAVVEVDADGGVVRVIEAAGPPIAV